MPNADAIQTIAERFSRQYNIDLDLITSDSERLDELIENVNLQRIDSTQIYRDSITFSSEESAAFVPDIETFAFSEAPPDPRINSRRIEQNLEEAAGYLQTCHQLRLQYGEIAKLRNDTRFKGEEFIRLDLVHLAEVEAGLYKLPWQEAAAEREALEKAIAETNAQNSIIDEMMRTGASGNVYSAILSDARVDELVGNTALIARNSANKESEAVELASRITTKYHSQLEYANWLQVLAASKERLAQLNGRLSVAKAKEGYLLSDEGFRSHRAAISRQLAWLQMHEHCRPSSSLNYTERLESQRTLFTANLKALTDRVIALKSGLKDYYGIDMSLEPPERGRLLDVVSPWLVSVNDELQKYRRAQRVSILTLFNVKPVNVTPRAVAGTECDLLSCEVFVGKEGLPGSNSLLRGVTLEFLGSYPRPICVDVLPPGGAYAIADVGVRSNRVSFGRTCSFTPASDPRPQYTELFWNGSAEGVWRVEAQFDGSLGDIEGVVIHLWLACV